ncbi:MULTISPECIES: DUF5993 family protein [Candidatus Rhabdochlamydia]|uniref:DUF5993 family protein n=1 Tax=Candidatus Rhabdochlamydia TaxID=292833 RepID=UPI003312FC3A
MMVLLFFIFMITILFIWKGYRKVGIGLTLINLVFCLFMLWHHATDILKIRI